LAFPVVVACGALIGLAGAARAQVKPGDANPGLSQSGQTSASQKTNSRIERYAKVLGLDANQTEAARNLYEAYQKDTRAAAKKMQSVLQSAQDDMNAGDHAAFEKGVQKSMAEHAEASKRLTEKFLGDLKSILHEDQASRWPALERLRRREQFLNSMMSIGGIGVSGSSVDLIPIVRKLTEGEAGAKLSRESWRRLEEMLGLYEMDVDRPLRERQQNMEDEQKTLGAVQHFEQAEFEKKLERDRKVDLEIREVNGKYLKQIEGLLPEDLAKKLSDNYQVRAFRNIYKTSGVAKKMSAAMRVPGLSEDQKSRLQAAMDAYRKEARAANDRWAAAQYKAETDGRATGGGLVFFAPGGPGSSGEKVDPELADARSARRAVDDRARSQLEGILTPEQMAAIPKPEVGQGGLVRTVSVFGDDLGEDAVFVNDIDMGDDAPAGDGAPVVIIRTVEGPGGGTATEDVKGKKGRGDGVTR
jgi:hypothetical protein